MRAHAIVGGDQTGRRIDQPLGNAHLFHPLAQSLLEALDQGLMIGRRLFVVLGLVGLVLCALDVTEIDGPARHRLQRLAFELIEEAQHPFVHPVGEQQHLDALLAENFELWAGAGDFRRLCGDVINGFLTFFHPRDIVGQ